ncbi:DUF485 domain-containing protein [Actinomadura gamaensis]|uniref:DUF485 domain-containing protein n=1 Tax=Actinomadura gamaensis TaxID=1763541 RepID=A0ABV9UE43_9ACTN
MARDERFRLLRRRFARLALAIAGSFLGWYFLYVALSAFARDFMARTVVGNVNVALVLGVLQFASTFALAWCYARYASESLDPLASALRDEADAPAAIRAGRQRAALHPGFAMDDPVPAAPARNAPASPPPSPPPSTPIPSQVEYGGIPGGPEKTIDAMLTQPLWPVLPAVPPVPPQSAGPPPSPLPAAALDDEEEPERPQPEPGVGPLPGRQDRRAHVPGPPGPADDRPGQVPGRTPHEDGSDAWSGTGVRPDPGWLS